MICALSRAVGWNETMNCLQVRRAVDAGVVGMDLYGARIVLGVPHITDNDNPPARTHHLPAHQPIRGEGS